MLTLFLWVLLCNPMLETQDLKEITTIVTEAVGVVEKRIDEKFQQSEKHLDKRFDDFAGLVNRSLAESEQRLNLRLDGIDQRIDKLYSLVDGFISLHQKLD